MYFTRSILHLLPNMKKCISVLPIHRQTFCREVQSSPRSSLVSLASSISLIILLEQTEVVHSFFITFHHVMAYTSCLSSLVIITHGSSDNFLITELWYTKLSLHVHSDILQHAVLFVQPSMTAMPAQQFIAE